MNYFTQTYQLRTMDFDQYRRLQPAAVLDLFQDAAGTHAAQLGLGYDAMRQRGLLWVVLRVYYEMCAQPRFFDTVQVQTWPHTPGVLDFVRDYRMLSTDGRVLARGTSQWAVIHTDSRKLAPAKDVAFPAEAICDEALFPGRLRKLPDFTPEGEGIPLRSAFSDVDCNGHVNNARYANYVVNVLRPDAGASIRTFQMDYHCEVLPDTTLTLLTAREGDTVRCKGCDDAGTLMFTSRIGFGTGAGI